MAKITILGCGYGTALGVLFTTFGHEVVTWTKFEQEAELLRTEREHKRLLPGVKLPESLGVTTDPKCVSGADIVLVAIPSPFFREAIQTVKPYVDKSTIMINVSKGLEAATGYRLSQIISEELPENPVGVITGPCHAEEIARLVPTTEVCASNSDGVAEYIQRTLSNEKYRIYVNDDVARLRARRRTEKPDSPRLRHRPRNGSRRQHRSRLHDRGMTDVNTSRRRSRCKLEDLHRHGWNRRPYRYLHLAALT